MKTKFFLRIAWAFLAITGLFVGVCKINDFDSSTLPTLCVIWTFRAWIIVSLFATFVLRIDKTYAKLLGKISAALAGAIVVESIFNGPNIPYGYFWECVLIGALISLYQLVVTYDKWRIEVPAS